MKKINFSDITYRYVRPEHTQQYPTEIFLGDVEISRGKVIEFEGSEGVVVDFVIWQDDGSREFDFGIFWFAGNLSADKARRRQTYGLTEFLKFMGCELVEE